MGVRWFYSRTVRRAGHMIKHVDRYTSAQRDLLPPERIERIHAARQELQQAIDTGQPRKELRARMENMETVANKNFQPYPAAAWRENIEVLLVAIAVAMGIRTFFVQPFKIPTGSMQPTLYGITSTPDHHSRGYSQMSQPDADFEIPNPVVRFLKFWWAGVGYTHVKARQDGRIDPVRGISEPKRFLLFNLHQRFYLEGDPKPYNIWFPPDGLFVRAGLMNHHGEITPQVFKAGEDIMKIKVISGDHLFVDRMTYNFRRPKLGEIIVFETRGIPRLPPDQFYIKRMVGMGGQNVQIGNDRHIRINGQRLGTNTPHFERVYSFPPDRPPMDSVYSGHLNEYVARQHGLSLASHFDNEQDVFTVSPDHYIVMGDNTVNSSDSRSWGDFPQGNVIGRSFLVYWPFGAQDDRKSRFGWGNR
jgi:signal peptidase I